ncbi:ComEC/Rec2 family competence protein [Flammeovirga sp. EKP202]|uniref:ComEC/Rec2 family competence protein n=1 Tax=Flammeovirga sp. EKP202 TaxID=2770592 RepID=UPI00165F1596|nr:ComEC/Rec2 family competence protein [Flammeovirga sp. EKP202]MBD0402578.1 ComEC/Rec2 family competence protein [Flammeovirga sp. EKP202]
MIHNAPFFKINIFLILGILFSALFDTLIINIEYLILFCILLFMVSVVLYRKNTASIFPTFSICSTIFMIGFTLFQSQKTYTPFPKHKGVYLEVTSIISEKEKVKRYLSKVRNIDNQNLDKLDHKVVLTYFGSKKLFPQSVLYVPDSLQLISKNKFPFVYDYTDYLIGKNIHYQITTDTIDIVELHSYSPTFRDQLQQKIKTIFPIALHGISSSLLIGSKKYLQQNEYELFQQTGNMHLLALSGMHVGIIVLILDLVFFWRKYLNIRTAQRLQLLYLPLLWFYASIAGFTPSILRAVSMFSILILGKAFHQKVNLLNLLCFVSFCFLIYDPFLLFDIGFILSFSAVLFISVFQHWDKIGQYSYIIRTLFSIIIVSILAQLGTISFTSYFFQYIPAYSLFSSVLSGFFTLLLMYNGLLILLLDALHIPISILIDFYEWTYFLFQKWLLLFKDLPQLPWVNISALTAIVLCITIYINLAFRRINWLSLSLMFLTLIIQYNTTYLQHQKAVYFYASKTPMFSFIDHNQIHSFVLRDSSKTMFEYETIIKKHQSLFSNPSTHFINMNQKKESIEIQLNDGLIYQYSNPYSTLHKNDSTLLKINHLTLRNTQTRIYSLY